MSLSFLSLITCLYSKEFDILKEFCMNVVVMQEEANLAGNFHSELV